MLKDKGQYNNSIRKIHTNDLFSFVSGLLLCCERIYFCSSSSHTCELTFHYVSNIAKPNYLPIPNPDMYTKLTKTLSVKLVPS